MDNKKCREVSMAYDILDKAGSQSQRDGFAFSAEAVVQNAIGDRSTMRNNSKATGVCVFESIENLQSYLEVDGISEAKFQEGSFSCDLWFYPKGDSYTLLSQPGGFSLSVEDNKFKFTFVDGASVKAINTSTEYTVPEITKNSWNNVFVSYDKTIITFYLSGCPIFSTTVGAQRVVLKDISKYKIGGDFTGQMLSVRLYNRAMPNTESDNGVSRYICKYQYDAAQMPELVAWIDFSKSKIESVTGLALSFYKHNVCYLDNAIQAIAVSGSDYAYTTDRGLNPIATLERQHAIYIKFFTGQSSIGEHVLFSNGEFDQNDAFLIYMHKNYPEQSPVLMMRIGQQYFPISSYMFFDNTWNDLLVTFSIEANDKIKPFFYINGELQPTTSYMALDHPYTGKVGNGAVKLGNALRYDDTASGKVTSHPFDGYITTVAIFDQSLLENKSFVNTNKAMEFHENEPFIYEPGLVALYSVDGNLPMDLISGLPIIMSNNSSQNSNTCSFIGSVTGTNNPDLQTFAYNPYLPSYQQVATQNCLSEIDQRDLDMLGEVLFGYLAATAGVTLPEDSQKLFLYSDGQNYLNSTLMSDIKLKKTVTADSILGFILQEIAALTGVKLSGFLGSAAIGAAAVTFFDVMKNVMYAYAFAEMTMYLVKCVQMIVESLNNKKEDEEEKAKPHLTYENFKMEAIGLSEGLNASLDVSYANQIYGEPTWSTTCGLEGHPSVFVVDKLLNGIMNMKIHLRRTNSKGPTTAKVKITAKANTPTGNLFTEFTATETCTINTDNHVKLISTGHHRPLEDNIYKYVTTYTITCTIDGIADRSMTVKLPMYSIPKTPRKPIGHGKRNAVITEFLDMLSTSSSAAYVADAKPDDATKNKITIIPEHFRPLIERMMRNLFNCNNLEYVPADRLTYGTYIEDNGISGRTLDIDRIQEKYATTRPLPMQCAAYSIVLAYGLNLFFNNVNIVTLRSNILTHVKENLRTTLVFASGHLHGGGSRTYDFNNHVITKVDDYYLDGSCRINEENPVMHNGVEALSLYIHEVFQCVINTLPTDTDTGDELTPAENYIRESSVIKYIGQKEVLFLEELLMLG